MGNYAIIDTGYANTSQTGTQETLANSGNAVEFKSASLTYNRGVSLDDAPNPARYEDAEVNYASQDNPTLVLTGVVDRTETSYETFAKNLDDMCITKGFKLFYYSSGSDGYKDLATAFGAQSYGSLSVSGSLYALLVRVKNFRITEKPGSNLATYSITIVITNEVSA